MNARLDEIRSHAVQTVASATLSVRTKGAGFIDITAELARFLAAVQAGCGVVLVYLRHTSASLVIQENADPDVQHDLLTALDRLAPEHAGWIHTIEGADDMPAHIKAMLAGVSLHIPVVEGRPLLGTWQGLYLVEQRRSPHERQVILQFIGSGR